VKLLVLGNDESLNSSMAHELSLRHEAIETSWLSGLEWWAAEWKAALAEFVPDFVINLAPPARGLDAATIKRYRKVLVQLAEACSVADIPLLHLSSVLVFDGDKSAPYQEGDAEAPYDAVGESCLQLEEAVAANARRFVILRTASVFSSSGDNLLTQIIRLAEQRKTLVFDPSLAGCPTCADDVARVIIAIVLQLHCGADSWGIYHYTSSDVTSGYQFAEAVLAVASQFDRELHLEHVRLEERAVERPEHLQIDPIVVACQKLLNTFGIKQRPWRSQLTFTVRNYFGSGASEASPSSEAGPSIEKGLSKGEQA
jgi:dTDP-4-dehydrorhamnose reductase